MENYSKSNNNHNAPPPRRHAPPRPAAGLFIAAGGKAGRCGAGWIPRRSTYDQDKAVCFYVRFTLVMFSPFLSENSIPEM